MKVERRRVVIAGRVQGVGYRYAACDEARRLGLGGWVRNLDDGRVEALIEGAPQQLDAMIAWCWQGPRMARVSSVAVEPCTGAAPLEGFRIR